MFFGGLNGDGFFNEEYMDDGPDGYDGYPSYCGRDRDHSSFNEDPLYYHKKVKFRILIETDKAYRIKVKNTNVVIWLPKSWFKKMNKKKTKAYIWGEGFNKNLDKALKNYDDELRIHV